MIADLKSYPAMKDCGVPWLDMVPETWDVQSLKRVMYSVSEQDQASPSPQHYIALEHVQGWTGRIATGDTAPVGSQLKRFRKGDVLFGKLRPYLAKVAQPAFDGHCVGEFLVLRARGAIDGHYAEQMLRAAPFIDLVNSTTDGARMPRAEWDDVGSLSVPVPPRPEQAAIVRFLDHASRRIGRYIRAKQQLIRLLEEQKQAVIHRAVTRGLDPNVRFKPSAVEALGDVPEHWERMPFTRTALERADYRGATPTKTDSGAFLVTARNVRKGWIDYEASKEYVAQESYATIMRRGLPRQGDLLLTMEAPLGHAALVDREDVALAQRIVRFRFDTALVEPRFALLSVLSPYFQDQLLRRGTGSTAMGIKASKLPQLQLLVPPIAEQRSLLAFVNDQCRPVEGARQQAESEIALLHEYRTRLIADVVTGKLDVREAAAGLPDELEQIDEADLEEVVDDELADDLDAELEEVEA